MKEALLGGILMMLAVIAVLLFQLGWSEGWQVIEERNDPLNVSSLKEAEQEKLERYQKPKRDGKIDTERLERYELDFNGGLARADVSKFFKKDIPIDKPNLPNTYLLAWYALAASDILTFGFHDYKARLSLASDYFTEKGWKSFSKALQRSRIIEMVEVNQQIVTAAPKGAPFIQSGDVVDGRYQWVVEMPLVMTYRSGAKKADTGLLVTAVIVRSDDPKHPYGVAIQQWVALAR